ncbi:uncharacterized protein LOC105435565 [Cucumis sativus]|uniref:Uncharacterized protein n=1 Tax=Cucumis sativus TaxID=3659 RepID=A0A0A0KQF7_CUCSA|nr:uncharacterized protein LOC105435565 [Cucumis sativus]KGN51858.1 hypothetical protein Csa_008237 [Cucumis sativus]
MKSVDSCCYFSYLKVLLGAVVVGLFVWLLVVGSSPPPPGRTKSWQAAAESVHQVEGRHAMKEAEDQLAINNHPKLLDPNFMSKVRVPKGPDPIHNRRIGVKGGPPRGA